MRKRMRSTVDDMSQMQLDLVLSRFAAPDFVEMEGLHLKVAFCFHIIHHVRHIVESRSNKTSGLSP